MCASLKPRDSSDVLTLSVRRLQTHSPTPSDSQSDRTDHVGLTVSPAHLRYHLLEEANLVVGPQIRAGALVSWSPRPNILKRSVETECYSFMGIASQGVSYLCIRL